mgnify:CR=1 FL=1
MGSKLKLTLATTLTAFLLLFSLLGYANTDEASSEDSAVESEPVSTIQYPYEEEESEEEAPDTSSYSGEDM